MNHIIQALKDHMTTDLEAAIEEQEEDILKAINKVIADRDPESESPLTFTVSMSGKVDLGKNTVETKLSYSVRTTVAGKHFIENPDQGKFGF